MKKKTLMDYVSIIFVVLAFVIIYAPIILIFMMSFTSTYSLSEVGEGFTFKWYQSLFTTNYESLNIATKYIANTDSLKVAILNTFFITILSTIISTFLGTMFSIGIHALNKKRRTTLMVLNNMPVVNPDIVTGFLLLLIFVLFQTLFGLERGWFTVLLAHIFFSIPYVVLSVLPRLNQIDPNTYEAARDLGCTRLGAVFKAIIPSITTGIVSGAMFAFTMSIDDFVITMFVSGTEFYNVSTWIDSAMRRGFIPKGVYAYNVIIFLIASVIVLSNNYLQSRKARKFKEAV